VANEIANSDAICVDQFYQFAIGSVKERHAQRRRVLVMRPVYICGFSECEG